MSGRESLKRQRLLSSMYVADENSEGDSSSSKYAWGTVTLNLPKTEDKTTGRMFFNFKKDLIL